MPPKSHSLSSIVELRLAVMNKDAKVDRETRNKVINTHDALKRRRDSKKRAAKLARKRNRR